MEEVFSWERKGEWIREPMRALPLHQSNRSTSTSRHLVISKLFTFIAFCALSSLLWTREFSGPDGQTHFIYTTVFGGFRIADIAILCLSWLILLVRFSFKNLIIPTLPSNLTRAAGLFLIAIGISFVYGWLTGGTELFFDWRNIVLGVLFGLVIVNIAGGNTYRLRQACLALITVIGLKGIYLLFAYVLGWNKVMLFDFSIPVFDGPTLSNNVFAAVIFTSMALTYNRGFRMQRYIYLLFGLLCATLVILAMRRTYWAELVVAVGILLSLVGRGRVKIILAIVVAVITVYTLLGEVLTLRIQSVNPFNVVSPYAATNLDHINDILDAWDQITRNPILGLGLGKPYETVRISGWKPESWGVHNAIIHVWLRYGLWGMLSYLTFHINLFGWLYKVIVSSKKDSFTRAWTTGSFSYLMGSFIVSLGFSPWPYGALQNTVMIFSLLGLVSLLSRYELKD